MIIKKIKWKSQQLLLQILKKNISEEDVVKALIKAKYKNINNKKIKCLTCNKKKGISFFKKRKVYLKCKHYIMPTRDTMLFRSHISLVIWWKIICENIYQDKPVTSTAIMHKYGMSNVTALKINRWIKKRMPYTQMKLTGILQVDETFLGIYAKNTRKNKFDNEFGRKSYIEYKKKMDNNKVLKRSQAKGSNKLQVFVVVENSTGFCTLTWHLRRGLIQWEESLEKHKPKILFSDGSPAMRAYSKKHKIEHYWVNHSKHEYVKVENNLLVTTNKAENVWSIVKRRFKLFYVSTKLKNLQIYLNSEEYCYNRWKICDPEKWLPDFLKKVFFYNQK